jgi:tetratricopeptide (TPR) repeat protein
MIFRFLTIILYAKTISRLIFLNPSKGSPVVMNNAAFKSYLRIVGNYMHQMLDRFRSAYNQIKMHIMPQTQANETGLLQRLPTSFKAIEQFSFSLLKIILILFIIIYLFGIYHWINEREVGLVVQPFETNSMGEIDGKTLDGKPFAALLRFDLQNIQEVWNSSISEKGSQKDTSSFSFPTLFIKDEALEYSISDLGDLNLEGSSFSVGSMLLSMKAFSGNRAGTITSSLQRYNSTILAVAILEDRHSPQKKVKIFQAKKILDNNSSTIEQIPDLIDDLAFQISHYFSMQKELKPEYQAQTWQAFKYLTQGRNAYINYVKMNNSNELDHANDLTVEAIKFGTKWKIPYDMLLIMGFSYLERNNYEKASNIFINIYPVDPFNSSLGLGLVYGKQKDFNRSLHELDKATRLNPQSPIAWYNKGVVLNELKKTKEAIKSYDKVIMLNHDQAIMPNSIYVKAWYNKACSFKDLGDRYESNMAHTEATMAYKESIMAYNKTIELAPNHAKAWQNKGVAYYKQHLYNESLQAYNITIDLDPTDADSWFSKGRVLHELNRSDEEIQAYDNAIMLNGSDSYAWLDKGRVLLELGNYPDAFQAYDMAFKLKPELVNGKIWKFIGNKLSNQSSYDLALKAYEYSIKLAPKDADALNRKGNALKCLGNYPEAIKAYGKAIKLNQSRKITAMAWNSTGSILCDQGKYNDAIKAYDKAAKLDPTLKIPKEIKARFCSAKCSEMP